MISRRQMLAKLAATAAGATAAVVSGGVLAQAKPKLKPTEVAYQTTPMGDQRCANCSQFTSPNVCAILTSRVVPSGWCNAWVIKPQ